MVQSEYSSIINLPERSLHIASSGDVGREGQGAGRGRVLQVGSYVSYVWRDGANMEGW